MALARGRLLQRADELFAAAGVTGLARLIPGDRGPSADKLDQVADELLSVAQLLVHEPRLRKVLVAPAVDEGAKQALLADLLGKRVSGTTVDLLAAIAGGQRVGEHGLIDLVLELGAHAAFGAADRDGTLERTEGELADVAAVLGQQRALRAAMTDPALPTDRKQAVLRDLVGGQAQARTLRLLDGLLEVHAGRGLDRDTATLAGLAAERRGRVIAEVRTAVELDPERVERLAGALGRAVGRQVDVRVVLDPSIIGSVVARVGDEVFDGSVRRRLDQAREELGAA